MACQTGRGTPSDTSLVAGACGWALDERCPRHYRLASSPVSVPVLLPKSSASMPSCRALVACQPGSRSDMRLSLAKAHHRLGSIVYRPATSRKGLAGMTPERAENEARDQAAQLRRLGQTIHNIRNQATIPERHGGHCNLFTAASDWTPVREVQLAGSATPGVFLKQ